MNATIVIILILSGISNIVADLFLVSGGDFKRKESKADQARQTPMNHLVISGVLGLISISFWMVPVYYLSALPGIAGFVALLSFGITIATLTTYHAVCSFVIISFKLKEESFADLGKTMKYYGALCIIWSSVYTGCIIYLSVIGFLKMGLFHYLTLPLFSMIIVQFMVGSLLRKIPHFSSIAGSLAMIISLLSTVHIMIINNIR